MVNATCGNRLPTYQRTSRQRKWTAVQGHAVWHIGQEIFFPAIEALARGAMEIGTLAFVERRITRICPLEAQRRADQDRTRL